MRDDLRGWPARSASALAAALTIGALAPGTVAGAPAAAEPDPVALAERGECGRCHGVERLGLPPVPRAHACAGCHQWIHASTGEPAVSREGRARYPAWDRYVSHVSSYLEVPDLAVSAARLRPDFVASYLRAPFQVRPALAESMLRAPFSAEEAAALATWLTARARLRAPGSPEARAAAAVPPSAARADVRAGASLYASLGCGLCHARGARAAPPAPAPVRGAPDLGLVVRRMTPADAAAFIADPSAYGAETKMPTYSLTATQAARLRDFLWAEAQAPAGAVPVVAAVPAAGAAASSLPGSQPHRATYAEVRARVFDPICIHCHMDPAKNEGEGGPGNTGGLGFRGAGLDLESWAGIRRGARDARGRRVSILEAPAGGGDPPLLRRLRQRVVERRAELVGEPLAPGSAPGMPLGLSPLGTDELSLVERWLAAGAPGPDGRPGRPSSPPGAGRHGVRRFTARQ